MKNRIRETLPFRRVDSDCSAKLRDITEKLLLNLEFEKAGDTPPYDWLQLHKEAQAIREKRINEPLAMDNELALKAPSLFPEWDPTSTYKAGQRVRYNGALFNVIQDVTAPVSNWTPDVTHSHYKPTASPAELGTIDSPIRAVVGMSYEKDKFYKEGEKTYLCTRSETLYHLPSALVGHYFEEVG